MRWAQSQSNGARRAAACAQPCVSSPRRRTAAAQGPGAPPARGKPYLLGARKQSPKPACLHTTQSEAPRRTRAPSGVVSFLPALCPDMLAAARHARLAGRVGRPVAVPSKYDWRGCGLGGRRRSKQQRQAGPGTPGRPSAGRSMRNQGAEEREWAGACARPAGSPRGAPQHLPLPHAPGGGSSCERAARAARAWRKFVPCLRPCMHDPACAPGFCAPMLAYPNPAGPAAPRARSGP